jgi:hypothetical protein
MTESCPISPEVVDDHATRIGAALVILIVIAGLWQGRFWIPLLLAVDFGLRSRGWGSFSPIAQLSQALRSISGLQPLLINAGPKRFAALIGVIFSLSIAIALGLRHPRVALALAAVLILAASLEAFFGYCVGCKVYALLLNLRTRKEAPDASHG